MRSARNNIRFVLGHPQYGFLALVIAGVFYACNVLITSWEGITGVFAILGRKGMPSYIRTILRDYIHAVDSYTFVFLVLLSLLFGSLGSLIIYKVVVVTGRKGAKKGGILASIGLAGGLLVSSCAACGIGLFSVLGIGTAVITLLPFGGKEVSVIAVLILLISVWQFGKNLYVCKR